MATIRLYLTSLEPDIAQAIYSQSIGGYYSTSLVYPEATLASNIGLYDTSFTINTPEDGWTEWLGLEYVNIGNEIIKVSPIVDGDITVVQRGYNGITNMHIGGDVVRSVVSKELFNNSFNDSYKQYRCIAAKNDSAFIDPSGETTAYDMSVFVKQDSRNDNSVIKLALEQPNHQYFSGSSTSWNSMQIIDTSLISVYEDDYFKESYLKVLSGEATDQGRVISSFDTDTGTFTFYNSFSSSIDFTNNISYEVLPSPAQRITTGTDAPISDTIEVTEFLSPDESSPLQFGSEASIYNVTNLSPNEVVYIWIERTLTKGKGNFDVNNIIIDMQYSVSG